MKFRNPANGHIENKSAPALWCFLFGAFYFLVSGIWIHALVMFIISVVLFASMGPPATLIVLLMNVVYCFIAGGIVESYYLRKGWEKVNESPNLAGGYDGMGKYVVSETTEPEEKNCPFCAEKIKYAAIKCKHCGADLAPTKKKLEEPPPSDAQQMKKYDISFDGERYVYAEYKYDRLSDAINYAKLQKG